MSEHVSKIVFVCESCGGIEQITHGGEASFQRLPTEFRSTLCTKCSIKTWDRLGCDFNDIPNGSLAEAIMGHPGIINPGYRHGKAAHAWLATILTRIGKPVACLYTCCSPCADPRESFGFILAELGPDGKAKIRWAVSTREVAQMTDVVAACDYDAEGNLLPEDRRPTRKAELAAV